MTSTQRETPSTADLRRRLLWPAGLALLWVVLAIIWPATTYHLAPLLIAAVPLVLVAFDQPESIGLRSAIMLTLFGVALAVGAAILLEVLGKLQGPAFDPFSSPFTEALAAAVAGAVIGLVVAFFRKERDPIK